MARRRVLGKTWWGGLKCLHKLLFLINICVVLATAVALNVTLVFDNMEAFNVSVYTIDQALTDRVRKELSDFLFRVRKFRLYGKYTVALLLFCS